MLEVNVDDLKSISKAASESAESVMRAEAAGRGSDAVLTVAAAGLWAERQMRARGKISAALVLQQACCERYTEVCDGAVETLEGSLIRARDSLLELLGGSAGPHGRFLFDDDCARAVTFFDAAEDLKRLGRSARLIDPWTLLLPGAEKVTGPLSQLGSELSKQEETMEHAYRSVIALKSAVSDFESTYSSRFSSLLDTVTQETKDEAEYESWSENWDFVGSLIENAGLGTSSGEINLATLKDQMTAWANSDNWESALEEMLGADAAEILGSDAAGIHNAAEGVTDMVSVTGKTSKIAKGLSKLSGAAKFVGYVGDLIQVSETITDSGWKLMKGDVGGAAIAAGCGLAKFGGAKLIGALAVGTLTFPWGAVVAVAGGVAWNMFMDGVQDGSIWKKGKAFMDGAAEAVDKTGKAIGSALQGAGDFFGGLIPSFG